MIATARLRLRDFRPDELPAFLAWHEEPGYADYYGPGEAEPAHMRGVFAKILGWAAESPRLNWQLAIEADAVIGTIGIRTKGLARGQAEFGLGLAPRAWGLGYASEAARAMIQFAWDRLGVLEIRGLAVTENARVRLLMTRLGFRSSAPIPGPEWMELKGWSHTEWTLTRGV
ncbi:MAG: GNAT family N-acetyltransferase [Planctomycetes bacterium]|nr:GNAT family N-acetyltransferase [Planctomycetota bacterium]